MVLLVVVVVERGGRWVEGRGSTLYARLIMWLTASVDGSMDC